LSLHLSDMGSLAPRGEEKKGKGKDLTTGLLFRPERKRREKECDGPETI